MNRLALALLVAACLNAQPPLAKILTPTTGSTLGASATFTWTAVPSSAYWFDLGNSQGQGDIIAEQTSAISRTVANLPCDGRTLWVRLWTQINGQWINAPQDYQYKTCVPAPPEPPLPAVFSILSVRKVDAKTLSVGAECSQANPCNVRINGTVWAFTQPRTVTLVAGLVGRVFFYVDRFGKFTPATVGLSITCSDGCMVAPGTIYPLDSIPIAHWDVENGSWSVGVNTMAYVGRDLK